MASSTPAWTAARIALVAGERLERRVLDARSAPPTRARSRRRARSAPCCRAAPSPITHAWPISGRGALERRLDVRRRHVLAGRVDDQLLLAVDDREVAVLVDLADVAGVQPAVGVERLGGLARAGCGSRSSRRRERISSSPSSAELDLDARRGRPDGADLDPARAGCTAPAPQVSDMPHSSASGMPMAWKNTSTSRGVGAAPTLTAIDLVEAEHRAQPGEQLARRPRRRVAARSSGTGSPACSSSTFCIAASSQRAVALARSSRWRQAAPPGPALSFSQMRGTAKNHVGLHLRQVARRSRAGSAQRRDRHRVDDRQVVVRVALGDVRAPAATRSRARRRGSWMIAVDAARPRPCRLRCASWTPFGGPVVPDV